MEHDELRRVHAFMTSVETVMGLIPVPVPPRPDDSWDGVILDAQPLYQAYNRLPKSIQSRAARALFLCSDVLERQGELASRAVLARFVMVADMIADGFLQPGDLSAIHKVPRRPEYLTLVPSEPSPGGSDEIEDTESAMAYLDEVRADVQAYVNELLNANAEHAGKSSDHATASEAPDDTRDERARTNGVRWWTHWPLWTGGVLIAAVVVMAFLFWLRVPPPAESRSVTINRSVQTRDLAVIVSHAERTDDDTARVHVHVVNSTDEPQEAHLSLGSDVNRADSDADTDIDADSGLYVDARVGAGPERRTPVPIVVPPRSTQHRVFEIHRGHKNPLLHVKTIKDEKQLMLNHVY